MPPVTSLCHMSSDENPGDSDSGLERGAFYEDCIEPTHPCEPPSNHGM